MAELPNEPKQGGDNEFSMEKRLLLAFILMGAVLFLTPYFYKPHAPPPQTRQTARQSESAANQAPAAKPASEAPPAPAAKPRPKTPAVKNPGTIAAQREQDITLETDLYKIVFSNRGAVVKSWILKKYVDSAGKPLELIDQKNARRLGFPFSLAFSGQPPALNPNTGLFVVKQKTDPPSIEFELSDGQTYFRKSFRDRKSVV